MLVIVSLMIIGVLAATSVVKHTSSFGRAYKLIALLILGWGIFSWFAADYYYNRLANKLFQQESKVATEQAQSIAGNIDDNIEMLKGVALMYARDVDTQRALLRFGVNSEPSSLAYDKRKQRWTRDRALSQLDNSLSIEAPLLGADLIFVLNAAGDCVAASNADKPGSAVGTNYADRKYFPLAQAGKTAHQYAVGRTTNVPGLYYVSPVFGKGRFVGAVVVKRDVEKFSRWTNPASAFVVDANGVIVLASDKNFEFHTMPDAPLAKLSQKEILAQYRRSALDPLRIVTWGDTRFPSALLMGEKNLPMLMTSKPLADDGITIYVPRSLEEAVRLGVERYWIFVLLAATGSMLIIAVSMIIVYRRESRRREVITKTFGKYVDPRIVNLLIEEHQLSQSGDKRKMTVYFCDLEGFTAISEKFNAEGVVKLLNQYLLLMSEPIKQHNGIIDKYIGDSIMAFWGPPFTTATEHPRFACLAALQQIEALKKFETQLTDLPRFNVRIGISTGEVIVGSVGSEVSKSYTVIGDNVNLASRLESINKYYGTSILICDEVWEMVKADIECREIDYIRVAGKVRPIRIFEVMGKKGELDEMMLELRQYFEAGLAAYRASRWDEGRLAFEKCIDLNPRERAAVKFLSRIATFQLSPPGNEWDGIWTFNRK